MAFRTPLAVMNENVRNNKGKGKNETKVPGKGKNETKVPGKGTGVVRPDMTKTVKNGLQERKALQDVSNTGNSRATVVPKGSARKPNCDIRRFGLTNAAQTNKFLSDEELKKCKVWAEDGIEQVHFTGNDMHKMQRGIEDKRVEKKVKKIMSALEGWSNQTVEPRELKWICEAGNDFGDLKIEMEPEVPPDMGESSNKSYNRPSDSKVEEHHAGPSLLEHLDEFQLKDDFILDDAAGFFHVQRS